MSGRDAQRRELEELLTRPSTDLKSWFVPEPALTFGRGQTAPDPKLGISLYGPCGTDDDQPLMRIRVGVIGTGQTIQTAHQWLERCRAVIDVPKGDKKNGVDPFLFPSFPGMSTENGFNCDLEYPDRLVENLAPRELARCLNAASRDEAVEVMAKMVSERLDALKDREPDVVLVALPEEVREKAGAGRSPQRRRPARARTAPKQLSFFDEKREEPDPTSRTLHRAIKGEGMRHGLPTQLVWPTTFTGGDGYQDDATRAWNFCTALYYKARGTPWRATGLSKATCYVGISFYRPLGEPGYLQTSMAQAFSERGEGIVLRGQSFQWDQRRHGPPQLPREAAKSLLSDVIEKYRKHHPHPPTRVVVHKSSPFSDDEIKGMEEALGDGVPYYDFLSVTKSNIRFLRVGAEPPVRGTTIGVASNRYVVYTRGYVPFLRLYPGLRIPRPLEVTHAKGAAPVAELLRELFALTRMNWNSADFASAEPITLGFSRKIGLILSELPRDVNPERHFRFYM